MEHRRVVLLSIYLLLFSTHIHIVSARFSHFPNFPTKDEYRVMVSANSNSLDEDITDTGSSVPIEMTHMRVRSEISMRYARTAIICNVYNPNRRPKEASFSLLLPETAFISGFTMTLGKETYEAFVKEKEVAKEIYNDAVLHGASAAQIATTARNSNQFTIKFNVEGRTNATYRLRYEEFLVRRNGVYNHAINLHPGTLVPKMDVVVHIKESQMISELRVPEMRTGNEVDAKANDPQNTKAVIRRGKNKREATITFAPDQEEQIRLSEIYVEKSKLSSDADASKIGFDSREQVNENDGMLGQFVVQYDVTQPRKGEVLVNDGYFVHFFAPSNLPPMSKHAVFVLDTSASMWGNKISQLRSAMDAILSDLHPNDYFSIIEFNAVARILNLDDVHRPHPFPSHDKNQDRENTVAPATPENIANAKVLISRLDASGGTNLYAALDMSLNIIHNALYENCMNSTNCTRNVDSGTDVNNNNKLEPIIVLLTDGEPTIGEMDSALIIELVSEKNAGRATVYSLAFGDGADRVFLRQLAIRNGGFMRHIYEAADAAIQLHDFYRQVSSPLLSHVKFLYPRRQIKEGSVSIKEFRTINEGSEVTVVGKVADGVTEITPQVLGLRSNGDGRRREIYEANPEIAVNRQKDYLPLERLWAYLTIKQLLDTHGANYDSQNDDASSEDSPKDKALDIALKYLFVTPLTSLVVVRLNKTDVEDPVNVESADEPESLVYKNATALSAKYTSVSTGTGLSVSTKDGPVLYVEINKRFTNSAYDSRWGTVQHVLDIERAWKMHLSTTLTPYLTTTAKDDNAQEFYPTSTDSSGDQAEKYLQDNYPWTRLHLSSDKSSLEFLKNGLQVILKISKDNNPPKASGGDVKCSSNPFLPTNARPENVDSFCVYLTRCLVARNFTINDYKENYCYVNIWYAGVCCPSNQVIDP